MAGVRERAESSHSYVAKRSVERLTKDHVSRIISRIGEKAGIIEQPDADTGKRLKYASAMTFGEAVLNGSSTWESQRRH